MKKTYLKLLTLSILLMGCLTFISCSGDDENEVETTITVNDLPASSQAFLKKYFPNYSVQKVEKDYEDNMIIYVVNLEEGYEVCFNESGDWTQVEAPYGKTVPTGFIPEQVMATLDQRFPGYGINEVNTTGEGYKVELSDNQGGAAIDIFFDMSGEIIKIDQMEY